MVAGILAGGVGGGSDSGRRRLFVAGLLGGVLVVMGTCDEASRRRGDDGWLPGVGGLPAEILAAHATQGGRLASRDDEGMPRAGGAV